MKIYVGNGEWLPFDLVSSKAANSLFYRSIWYIEDLTEAQFYASVPAGFLFVTSGFFAWRLDLRKSKFSGFSISYGSGLWQWVLVAQSLGLFVSIFACNYLEILNYTDFGWVPTFVPFVSAPPAVILIYGKGWRNVLTGGVLGGILGFPIAWLVIKHIVRPWGLQAVIGSTTGMWVSTIIVLEICKYLPWIGSPRSISNSESINQINISAIWFVRRVLADFSEAQFWGNELASLGLILGGILSWLLAPSHVSYGSGVFPEIFLSQVIGSSTAILLYHRWWKSKGWYPTFIPVVSVGPAVALLFNGILPIVIIGSVLGALIGPVMADLLIRNLPDDWHPVIGNTFSMAFTTTIVLIVLKWAWGYFYWI